MIKKLQFLCVFGIILLMGIVCSVSAKADTYYEAYLSETVPFGVSSVIQGFEGLDEKSGKTGFELVRESMTADVERVYRPWFEVLANRLPTTAVEAHKDGAVAEWMFKALRSYSNFNTGSGTNIRPYGYYPIQWSNVLYSSSTATLSVNSAGSYVNGFEPNDDSWFGVTKYLVFTANSHTYVIDLSVKPKNYTVNQYMLIAYLESFSSYTYCVYEYKSSSDFTGALTKYADFANKVDNLSSEDIVLSYFVHPMLGVVPCRYSGEEGNLDTVSVSPTSTIKDTYVTSIRDYVKLYFSSEAQTISGCINDRVGSNATYKGAYDKPDFGTHFSSDTYSDPNFSTTNPSGTLTAFDCYVDRKVAPNSFVGTQIVSRPWTMKSKYDSWVDITGLGDVLIKSDGTEFRAAGPRNTVKTVKLYMTSWEYITYTCRLNMYSLETLGLTKITITDDVPRTCATFKRMSDAGNMVSPVFLMNMHVPVAYVSKWCETNQYGIYSISKISENPTTRSTLSQFDISCADFSRKTRELNAEKYNNANSLSLEYLTIASTDSDDGKSGKPISYESDGTVSTSNEDFLQGLGEDSEPFTEIMKNRDSTIHVTVNNAYCVYLSLLNGKLYRGLPAPGINVSVLATETSVDGKVKIEPGNDYLLEKPNNAVETAFAFNDYVELDSNLSIEDFVFAEVTSTPGADYTSYFSQQFSVAQGSNTSSIVLNRLSLYDDSLDEVKFDGFHKHLIAIPLHYVEVVEDKWELKSVDSTTGGQFEINVKFYVESGRAINFNIVNWNSVDLMTENNMITFDTESSLAASGSYYHTNGRLSTSHTEPITYKCRASLNGPAIVLGEAYITQSGLLDWLQTNEAANFMSNYVSYSGYTANALYNHLVSRGASLSNTVTDIDDLTRLGEIEEELASNKQGDIMTIVFNVTAFVGIFVIAYSVLLVIAYYLDIFNTFVDIKLLTIMTLGGLKAVPNKEYLDDIGVHDKKERRHYATRNKIIVIWAAGVLLGIMLYSSNAIFLFILRMFTSLLDYFGLQ